MIPDSALGTALGHIGSVVFDHLRVCNATKAKRFLLPKNNHKQWHKHKIWDKFGAVQYSGTRFYKAINCRASCALRANHFSAPLTQSTCTALGLYMLSVAIGYHPPPVTKTPPMSYSFQVFLSNLYFTYDVLTTYL